MVVILIIVTALAVFLGITVWIDKAVIDAMVDEILANEERIEFLEEQVATQQDAMQASHGNFYDPKGNPVATPGPFTTLPQEDAFQLPLI